MDFCDLAIIIINKTRHIERAYCNIELNERLNVGSYWCPQCYYNEDDVGAVVQILPAL